MVVGPDAALPELARQAEAPRPTRDPGHTVEPIGGVAGVPADRAAVMIRHTLATDDEGLG
jgi:hypothetical protein